MLPKKIHSWLIILLLSITFPIMVLLITNQDSSLQKVFLFITLFLMIGIILLLLIPVTSKAFGELLKQKVIYYLLVTGLLFLPLSNWVFIDNFSQLSVELWSSFALWYVLPAVILIFPTFFAKLDPLRPIFLIGGVILLAIGFDNRNTNVLLAGYNDVGYIFNSIWVSVLILVINSIQYEEFGNLFNWEMQSKKFILPLAILISVGIVILPIGILTGFIVWAPKWEGIGMVIVTFLGIWFTIALPEELIARGVIQHQLLKISHDNIKKFERVQIVAVILLASFIFGLSHWNNTSADFIWIYIGLATVAGIGFGWCWQKSGLFSCMLLHTLIDFVWAIYFRG